MNRELKQEKKRMRIGKTKVLHAYTTQGETVVEAYVCEGCVRGTQVRALTHTVVSILCDTHTYNKSLG